MRGSARFTKMNKMFSSGVGPSGTNTSGLFSIPTPQTPAPPGQTSSSSQFSQQPNNFLFSSQSTTRPQSQSTLFGVQGSSTGSFGQQNSASQPSNSFYTQQQPIPASFNTHPFQYIQECLDPQSTNYRFRCFFYNTVDGGFERNPQTRPEHVSEKLWRQVLEDNPDPERMVPVLANGFSDLKQRRDWQQAVEDAQINKTDEIQERISSLLSKQDIDVSAQVQVIQKQQLRLTRRLLSLMVKINDLASDRTSLTIHEQETYNRMQNIVKTLNAHPLRDSEITALERRCDSLAESSLLDPFSSLKKEGSNSAASIPGLSLEGPDSLLELVSRQQKGISILIETLDRDSRDLDLIRHGIMQ